VRETQSRRWYLKPPRGSGPGPPPRMPGYSPWNTAPLPAAPPYSDQHVANRNVRDFGWEIAHAAVSRRPLIPLATIVARAEGYTYAVEVWDLSIVQGPFSVAVPYPNPLRFATLPSLYGVVPRGSLGPGGGAQPPPPPVLGGGAWFAWAVFHGLVAPAATGGGASDACHTLPPACTSGISIASLCVS
jgi:hypothetical protein